MHCEPQKYGGTTGITTNYCFIHFFLLPDLPSAVSSSISGMFSFTKQPCQSLQTAFPSFTTRYVCIVTKSACEVLHVQYLLLKYCFHDTGVSAPGAWKQRHIKMAHKNSMVLIYESEHIQQCKSPN